jgi:hypothetical protein
MSAFASVRRFKQLSSNKIKHPHPPVQTSAASSQLPHHQTMTAGGANPWPALAP